MFIIFRAVRFTNGMAISHKGFYTITSNHSHSFSFQMRSFMQILTNDWVTAIKHTKKLETGNWHYCQMPNADDMEEWWQFSCVSMQFITNSNACLYLLLFFSAFFCCSIATSFGPWALSIHICPLRFSTTLSNTIYHSVMDFYSVSCCSLRCYSSGSTFDAMKTINNDSTFDVLFLFVAALANSFFVWFHHWTMRLKLL